MTEWEYWIPAFAGMAISFFLNSPLALDILEA
jgi:hypothetical protein